MLTVIIPIIASFLLKRKIDLPYIKEYLIVFGFFLALVFLYFFLKRLVIKMGKNDIHIFQIPSDKNPKDKILLSIRNGNDENLINTDIELITVFVGQVGNVSMTINSDRKHFSKGLVEKGNIVLGNNHSEIEIAENMDGILKFLFDDEDVKDLLSNMPQYKKCEIFRPIINITGKLDGKEDFSHLYELSFRHFIDEYTEEIVGTNPPKFISKIEWINMQKEISPIKKNSEILKQIKFTDFD